MSRLLICVSILLGFVLPTQAQLNDDDPLPEGAIARLGEVRYCNVGRVLSIAFSPDGKTLLAGAWDGSIRLWDVTSCKELRQYPGHKGWVRSVAFAPDGKTFASGGKDKIIRLWETATGKELRRFQGHQQEIQYLTFSPDGKFLASRSWTLCLWDVATGQEMRLFHPRPQAASLAFSPDGKLLAYGGVNSVVLLDLATNKEVRQFAAPRSWFGRLAFAPNSRTLIGVNHNWDYMIYLWDTATGIHLQPLDKPKSYWRDLVFSPDGRSIASADGDRVIRVWELATRQSRCQFQPPNDHPSTLAYSPNGRILAQGSEDITVLLWDATGLYGKNPSRSTSLSAKELQALWADLASGDAAIAYRAIGKLAADSKNGVPFMQQHLRPVVPIDAGIVARLINDLDSEHFKTRKKATEQLTKCGDLAEPALRQALRGKISLEKRRRIDQLLQKLTAEGDIPGSERLLMLRALEALERMDTPAARQVIEQLAKGAPAASLTKEANAALKRLAKPASSQHQQGK